MLKFISMVLMSISVQTPSIREDICPISPLRPRNAFSQQTFLLKLHCTYGYINFEKASPTFMGGFGFWGLESSLVFFGKILDTSVAPDFQTGCWCIYYFIELLHKSDIAGVVHQGCLYITFIWVRIYDMNENDFFILDK